MDLNFVWSDNIHDFHIKNNIKNNGDILSPIGHMMR